MNSRSAIFTVTLVLLVPLGYSSFSANEACAVPPDPNWGGSNSACKEYYWGDGVEQKICCWFNDEGAIECQNCARDSDINEDWDCADVRKHIGARDILPDNGEPTIKDPPTTTEPKVPREDILPDETDEDEPTIKDPPTTTEPKILDPGKIEIPNLK